MKLLIITDAWHPQVNGVVRTLEATVSQLQACGHQVEMVSPRPGLFSIPAPGYPEITLEFFAHNRLRSILAGFAPDYIHIATEGPLGMAMRHICLAENRPYSTAYHSCFPEYLEKRVPALLKKPVKALTWQWIKRLHVPSCAVMVATPTLETMLKQHRIHRLVRWSRGVDVTVFKPYPKNNIPSYENLARPVFLYVGRVAVEKNLPAFLDCDLPGSKVVIGDGPQEALFRQQYPHIHFMGRKTGEDLARHYAAADVLVFPSKTDTFGLVLLEAVACGLAVAAFPVQGPSDVFADSAGTANFAVLDHDLGAAARRAARLPVDVAARHAYVATHYAWEHCTAQFLANLQAATPHALRRLRRFGRAMAWLHQLGRYVQGLQRFYPALYRCATFAVTPLLPFYLRQRAKRGKEDVARLGERFGKASLARPPGKLVWLHAASVGEAVSLLPLLPLLQQHPSNPTLLLTTTTRSAAELMAKRLPQGVMQQYIPLDTFLASKRFLQHWQPDMAILVESELWPEMLGQLHKKNIPAALINARMSEASARNWARFAPRWMAKLLASFQVILAQSGDDLARFQQLGAYHSQDVGNLKYAAPPLPFNPQQLAQMQRERGNRPCWLMASTHPGEEEIALACHQALLADYPDLITFIVPRHPARAEAIVALVQQAGLGLAQRSKNQRLQNSTGIYLADSFGELGLFYQISPIVCMGGSFVPVGGHNPLEPARFGAALVFGPQMFNFSTISATLLAAGAARQVTQSTLTQTLAGLLGDKNAVRQLGETAKNLCANQDAVVERTLHALAPLWENKANCPSPPMPAPPSPPSAPPP